LVGKFVKIEGVFSKSLDAVGRVASITLWTPGLPYVQTVGSLGTDSRFSIPITSSEQFARLDPRTMVRVRGVVHSQQPGQAITIWDDTGQIRILTKQFYPLRLGDTIEAIGYPTFQGLDRVLADGLFRLTSNASEASPDLTQNIARLYLADQVRSLDEDRLGQQLPASIEGVVTWANPRGPSFYVSDSSGGILVLRPRSVNGSRMRPGMLVKVDGVAAPGQFAPVITNAVARQTGIMNLPDAPLISLEQALTGAKDGCWVQMRGYVRKVESEAHAIQLHIVASGGEFTARVPQVDSLKTLQGSMVLVRGVCVVLANARHQLIGIQLWSPQEDDVQVEQSAPEDVFALPKHSVASLRRFNLFNTLNERVHTYGTVTLQVPGRYLYLQDGDYSVLVMSDQTEPLHPGDRVEVVGFSGHENGNFLLREAAYHRVSAGSDPTPWDLSASHYVIEDADGMLVQVTGKLLDVIQKSGETHLMLQSRGLICEARLNDNRWFTGQKVDLGSQLAVTGIYRIQRDEYGNPRSFLLNLRSGNDIRVLQPAPWWTLSRLLWALAGTLTVLLIALMWALGIRRKHNQLVHAQSELKAVNDKLEERVQERTRNLQAANEALQRSEERFVKAFRASPVPQLLLSADEQRCVDVNDSFLRLTGHNREEVLGQTPVGLKLFSKSGTGQEIRDALFAGRPVHDLQTELQTRESMMLTVLISAETFELEDQLHFLMSLQDITERLNVESQLRQAQKMEVVGQIAAGVAHDFNNILTVIQGHAEVQLGTGQWDESLTESLREISSAATRAASLTRQLLAFSRKQMLQRRPLDVSEALNSLSKMLQRIIGEHISLCIQCAGNLPLVFADAINFEQIIINLAVNARDAMPRGGPLTIAAHLAAIDAKYTERVPEAMVGTFLQLSVTDVGSGMDETVRSKIFEPFFTTKGVGRGTGMGLATVYGIVKQHQGWIEVESKPGAGSVFKVFLPLAEQETPQVLESKTGLIRAADGHSRTIFLVEDETPLREMASKILKRLGYHVVSAGNGPEALALWPQHRGKIDLLLTDMVMPGGMTGRELADCLLREAPGMPVIYSTGYSMDLINSETDFGTQAECLFKPYDASTLANAINKVFANGN
jgi:PAS domain S-box-containing protein